MIKLLTEEQRKENRRELNRKWNEKNKEKRALFNKKYYDKNKKHIYKRVKKYRKKNIDKLRKYAKEYQFEKYSNDKILYDTYNQFLRLSNNNSCLKKYYNKKQMQILIYHQFMRLFKNTI